MRAAERARENLYFAKLDEQLIERLREKPAAAPDAENPDPTPAPHASAPPPTDAACPRCETPLRGGLWRELEIEFCDQCGGLWLDAGDLLSLAGQRDLDVRISEN